MASPSYHTHVVVCMLEAFQQEYLSAPPSSRREAGTLLGVNRTEPVADAHLVDDELQPGRRNNVDFMLVVITF